MDRVIRAINAVLGRAAGPGDETQAEFDLVREAFDQTGVGLTLISLEGEYLIVNRAFCELSGYPKEELVGRTFRMLTHPDDIAADEAALAALRQAGTRPPVVEKRLLRSDGRTVWVRRNAGIMRDAAGVPRFVVGAFDDLTEQHARDRALKSANRYMSAIIDTSPIAIYATDLDGL
ncbi:MAG: PAS domain S-box protein, partial [Betaproteobacteria bacterium]|nr:PAS domain S-box protein [Betaproteobacteria bacterium]